MSWKVKAFASNSKGRKFKTVARADEYDDDLQQAIGYWVRSMEPGEKVVIERFHPGQSG